MEERTSCATRRGLAVTIILVAGLGFAGHAFGDGVGMFMVSKSLPESTVAVIDPESGTSSGGGSTDVRLAAGDIISFRFYFFPVPDNQIHGINGWLTEYIPPNTEVVGVRIVDENGVTIQPNYPGLAGDDCGGGCNGFDDVPCSAGVTGCVGGERDLDDGSIAQVYADTGIFYATASTVARDPGDAFITFQNGIPMSPTPRFVGNIDDLLGHTGAGYYAHDAWDWTQVRAYGTHNTISPNRGTGNTPYGYGSPVAGPLTFYPYEATDTGPLAPRFDDVVGPWNRIVYPGSTIGVGGPVSTTNTEPTRALADAGSLGYDVTPAHPAPSGTRAIRMAMGEIRVGEPFYAEVALRVLDTPIDPTHGVDADCAESFGGDVSAAGRTLRAKDAPWSLYLGAPGCVYLNLLFDLTNDRPLTVTGDIVTHTLRTKNLSTLTQPGAVVIQKFDGSRISFVGVNPGTPAPPTPYDCEGDGLLCLVWPARDYLPSEETVYETRFSVGGGGHTTHTMQARFTSTRLPFPGFTSQSIIMTRATGVVDATLEYAGPSTAPGGVASVTGDVGVLGTNNVGLAEYTVVLPAGWTLADLGGTSLPDIVLGGVRLSCSADCATHTPVFDLATNLAAGARRTISFDVNVPGGTATGLYPIEVSQWASQTGYGNSYETYFRNLATVAVGQARAPAPSIDCPCTTPDPPETPECGHFSSVSTITGTGAPAGSTVRVYLNGIERGSGTAAADGTWAVDVGPAFGDLYGGVEIRVTADGATTLESVLSDICTVRSVRACSDGLDNDGDGLTDFPEDPGCSSAGDNDETDVECSDGVDNDGDGDVDWPEDLECSGPDGTTEGGPPQCNDGLDNDGDGTADTADPCCVDALDRTETCFRQCNDTVDNDGDLFVDFADDAGCHAVNDDDETDLASSGGVDARLLFVFDTSGSMNWNTCSQDFTGGDGSVECGGNDVSCAACGAGGCGDGFANDSRIDKAKRGLSNVVAAYGEVEYGLMRFHQRPVPFACPTSNASAQSGGWQGAGAEPCGGGFSGGDLLVGFDTENQYDLLEWMDGRSNYPGGSPPPGMDLELRGTGTTPIAGSLDSARAYLAAAEVADPVASCRPYRVILLTDGQETCGGDPVASATALNAAGFPVYVIGFAVADAGAVADLNAIAVAGGTSSAIFVDDETTLSAAIADIIADTVLVEVCDGDDDDCDGLIDEGFTLYCDRPGGVTSPSLCGDPGETVCDGIDDNCNGLVDEGLLNACGLCGSPPVEVCNGLDDDCDGVIDEDDVCDGCVPEPEICDNLDNDCDGLIDEGLTRVCGTDVGECSPGTQACAAGTWGACTAVGPSAEACDGLDNDCDGVIDGITRPCGTDVGACSGGTETCTAGAWTGVCVGEVGPSAEICNSIDDDCDGAIDEDNPGGGGACGSDVGECVPGAYQCVGGVLMCTGGVSPSAESCNGLDDDCDTLVDEEVPTDGACGSDVGECRPGVRTCMGGGFVCVGARGSTTEVCNGLDDDCDGTADEENPGGGAVCGSSVGECAPGTTQCVSGSLTCVGDTGPTDELCDGLDNDCDGLTDEGNPEGGASCGDTDVGECEYGAMTCVSGSLSCVGTTGPSTEICDGLDNDCDGETDEGNPEGGDACGDSTGACEPGTTLCVSGSLVCDGAVEPTDEECNGIDDDCDGVVDDGIPVGAPCGTDEGECTPGVYVCSGGAIVCEGGLGPVDEVCNALDDDCDGSVDEGLAAGEPCGMDEGECVAGMIQCVGGRERCVGEVPPAREACDCLDNDCDGTVDEEPSVGTLCPPGTECIDCNCASRCVSSEFAPPCADGYVPTDVDGECWCVPGEVCEEATCAAETVEVDGVVECAPAMSGVPECTCKGNECTFPCSGVVCGDGTRCRADTGTCEEDSCRGLGCAAGEVCDWDTGECVADPCVDAACEEAEACRLGSCEPSCAGLECEDGERCRSGECVADACGSSSCGADEICDPEDGMCVPNLCVGRTCPRDTVCDAVTGECGPDPCLFLRCPEGEHCEGGECVFDEAPEVDGGVTTMDGGTTPRPDSGSTSGPDAGHDDEWRILATGGGGCLCSAPGARDERSGLGWSGLFGLLVLARVVRRRRSR